MTRRWKVLTVTFLFYKELTNREMYKGVKLNSFDVGGGGMGYELRRGAVLCN